MFISQTGPNIAPGDVSAYLGHRGDGMPYVVVNLGRDAALHVHTPEQADALIAAAVEAKRLLDPPATECPKCGTEWADEHGEGCAPVIAEPAPTGMQSPAPVVRVVGAAHMCECGHFEAYHVGAVKGDEHPGQCTSCGTCDTYAAAS